ncbi:hypothetical protein KUTeg_008762, partial [Tegillarca granosa]
DLNSPDVFETSDLPEDDQALQKEPEELSSESVEKIGVDTQAALGKFKGKGLIATGLDFSDTISANRRTGYDSTRTEYEMVYAYFFVLYFKLEEGGKIENPQQKFQRLQHEIRELAEEVHRIQENVKGESTSEKMSPVGLSKQLEYLQHQLNDLHLEKLLGPDASVDLSDPQGALQKRLLTQLDSYQPKDVKAKTPTKQGAPATSGGDNCVNYELYYRPEQAQFSKNARMARLEERLERLEAAIGQNQDKLGVLTADTDNKSLVGAVAILNSKLTLLDQANLDAVEARLHNVLHKLTQISEKKGATEDTEKQNKLQEMFKQNTEVVKNNCASIDARVKALNK